MSKIFSYSEIANGRIPRKEDFIRAKNLAFGYLANLSLSGEVIGAKVIGSVGHGKQDRRSDLDIVILTEPRTSSMTLNAIRDINQSVYYSTHVVTEPVIVPQDSTNGEHPIDEFFLRHIREIPSEGTVIGRDPGEMISVTRTQHPEPLNSYLMAKMSKFLRASTSIDPAERQKGLRRALEAKNIARKVVQTIEQLDGSSILADDTKESVESGFTQVFTGTHYEESYGQLVGLNNTYDTLLDNALDGRINEGQYNSGVETLASFAIPTAYKWTNELLHLFSQVGEGNRFALEGQRYHPRGPER